MHLQCTTADAKIKAPLFLRADKCFPLKPGLGQNIAGHACFAHCHECLPFPNFDLPGPGPCFPNPLPYFLTALVLTNAFSHAGTWNEIGQKTKQFKQVPMVSASGV